MPGPVFSETKTCLADSNNLLSILPTLNLLNPTFKLMRISRLLKVLRVVKFIRYFEPLEITLSVVRRQKKILCTVLSLAFSMFLLPH